MTKYKIDITPIPKLEPDSAIIKKYEEIKDIQVKLNKHINRYNYLIELRETLATVASQYLQIDLKELCGDHNMYGCDDTRSLLVRGCESEIKELKGKIDFLQEKFSIDLSQIK